MENITSDSAPGRGRVDKPLLPVVASPGPATPFSRQETEYFNNRPTQQAPRRPAKPGAARSRGQPPRLDDKLKALVVKAVARGLSRREAARHAGIDHSTISRAARRDPVFAASLKAARQQGDLRPRPGIRGWRQAVAVLKLAGFDPEWTREEKELLRG